MKNMSNTELIKQEAILKPYLIELERDGEVGQFVYYNDAIRVMGEYAQSLQRPGWVKASERLPKRGECILRVTGGENLDRKVICIGWLHSDKDQIDATKGKVTLTYAGESLSKVEWLDEGGSDGWISVDAGLPDENIPTLVIIPKPEGGYYVPFVAELNGYKKWWTSYDDYYIGGNKYSDKITHWQPLPSPPKQQP
jgi:hypothetical protein